MLFATSARRLPSAAHQLRHHHLRPANELKVKRSSLNPTLTRCQSLHNQTHQPDLERRGPTFPAPSGPLSPCDCCRWFGSACMPDSSDGTRTESRALLSSGSPNRLLLLSIAFGLVSRRSVHRQMLWVYSV